MRFVWPIVKRLKTITAVQSPGSANQWCRKIVIDVLQCNLNDGFKSPPDYRWGMCLKAAKWPFTCCARVRLHCYYLHYFISVRNEVAKVMFLQVYVCPQGLGVVVSQRALQVVSQHALQQVSRGSACSRRRGLLRGGGVWRRHTPPASRHLLLRTVRILLECILVKACNKIKWKWAKTTL